MISRDRHRFPSAARWMTPATVCLLAVAGCSSGGGAAAVAVPSPSAAVAAACRALHKALPAKVDGLTRRATRPVSGLTAAWGRPAVTLRCGVARPAILTPGNADYDPTTEAYSINNVDWLPEKHPGGYTFVTTDRSAFVSVTVPAKYAPEVNPLTDLASAIVHTLPTTL